MTESERPVAGAKTRILVVDDSSLVRLYCRDILEKAGFEHAGRYEIDSLLLMTKVPGHRFTLNRERWKGLAAA